MIITIIAGGNREHSTSTKLCRYIQHVLEESGCQVNFFDLYQNPLPLYSPETRDIPNENVTRLKNMAHEANGIVLSSPEYHGSMSGVLKNALDYLGKDQFGGKGVLSVSSSGGAVGVSTLQHMQTVVRYIHGINCPEWISIGGANRTFTDQGEPESLQIQDRVQQALTTFLFLLEKLGSK